MHTANCFEFAPAFEATARATAPDTGCLLATDRFLEFDFLLSDAMCLVPATYFAPSTAFLKSSPGPGCEPSQVARMASEVALPGSVPLALPLTSTVVPVPGTYVRISALPLGIASIHDSTA